MTLEIFIEQYCEDIVTEAAKKEDHSIFTFDAVKRDDEGFARKIIYDDANNEIDIDDIIHLTPEEFMNKYNFASAHRAFEKYLAAYEIISVKDNLHMFSNMIQDIQEQQMAYKYIDVSDL